MLPVQSQYSRTSSIAIALALVSTVLPGCAASTKTQTKPLTWEPAPAGEALLFGPTEAPTGWEYARLDSGLGAIDSPVATVSSVAAIRQFERLSDVNGRPRNNSWMYNRAVQIRVGP